MTALCGDGNNFAGRAKSKVLAAAYTPAASGGELLFGWSAKEGGAFPYPYTRLIRIRASDLTVLQEHDIWNSGYAWIYPSVHTNDRGHYGGVINWGCGTGAAWPNTAAWIIDDFRAFPDLLGIDFSTFASSNDAPDDDEWGDYNTTRVMIPFTNTWVGGGHRITGGGGNGDVVPEFVWFGRERDMPTNSNRVYVSWRNNTGTETGSWQNPYNTVSEGHAALSPGNFLIISGGRYTETVHFTTPSRVRSQAGRTRIRNE